MNENTKKIITFACIAILFISNIGCFVKINSLNKELAKTEELMYSYKDDSKLYQKDSENSNDNNENLKEDIENLKKENETLKTRNSELEKELDEITTKKFEKQENSNKTNNYTEPKTEEINEVSNEEITTDEKVTEENITTILIEEPKEEPIIEIIEEKADSQLVENKIFETFPDLYTDKPEYKPDNEYKTVYLTFDDGPSPDTTKNILETLDKFNIKATFFVTGDNVEKHQDILKEIYDRGHLIGIHTYSHKNEEVYESIDSYLNDFQKTYNIIYNTLGYKPTIFRFPGGSINSYNKNIYKELIEEMTKRGFTYYDWNASIEDATSNSSYELSLRTLEDTVSGNKEIILMHDTKEQTSIHLREYIEKLIELGYKFETLENVKPITF